MLKSSQRYNYSEQDLIGKGQFGVVYRAFDKDNKEFVAMKRILKDNCHNQEEFFSEIETLRKIPRFDDESCYKYLIQYRDFYVSESEYVLIMEFFDNSIDLQKFLAQKGSEWWRGE